MYKNIIIDKTTFLLWIKKLENSSLFAFHLNANIQNGGEIIGLSIAINIEEAVYLSLLKKDVQTLLQLNLETVLLYLKPILENNKIHKIGQDLKGYYRILKLYQIELSGCYFDLQVASYVINSLAIKNNINFLMEHWLPKDNNASELQNAAQITLKIFFKIWKRLNRELALKDLFDNYEMPLLMVLSHIESNGVRIDTDFLESFSYQLASRLLSLENLAYKIAGEYFNLASHKQVKNIFFKTHSSFRKTSGACISTNEKILGKLAKYSPLAKLVLEYRSLAKLKNSYTDKLLHLTNPNTRRVHSFYNQTLTTTGRISSSTPNLQNIPIRNEEGRKIRQAFIAPKHYKIVSADYSQMELRILAHLSHDKTLINCFSNQEDVHCFTAAELFGIKKCKVSLNQRRQAKIVNFGIIYGISAFGLSDQLNISIKAAQNYIDRYFQRYNGILSYINQIKHIAKKHGYVSTITGRKIYIPQIYSTNKILQKAALRSAINAPIQGTAADIIKLAMISLDHWINKNYYHEKVKMIIQVHDELVFEVEESILEKVLKIIREFMENSMTLEVPLCINIGVGNNWEQAH